MPVDLLIRSQLWPKERLQSYKSKRAKILKDFTDSKFFTILILNKIIKSILCKFCLQRMLHQSSSDAFFIGSCRPFFCGNGVVRTWKTKKIGVWFSLALFVTNQKIKPIQDGIQNKGYIANFYIVIVLERPNVWFLRNSCFCWPGPILGVARYRAPDSSDDDYEWDGERYVHMLHVCMRTYAHWRQSRTFPMTTLSETTVQNFELAWRLRVRATVMGL